MIEIKFIIIALCAFLKFIGEIFWHDAQRFIMPLIIGVGISFISQTWWLGFTSLIMIVALVEGYGSNSPLYKSLGDASARGMWLFLVCVFTGLGAFIFHHLSWYFYIPYTIIGGVLGSTLRNLNNEITSWISGAWIGVIVLLIH